MTQVSIFTPPVGGTVADKTKQGLDFFRANLRAPSAPVVDAVVAPTGAVVDVPITSPAATTPTAFVAAEVPVPGRDLERAIAAQAVADAPVVPSLAEAVADAAPPRTGWRAWSVADIGAKLNVQRPVATPAAVAAAAPAAEVAVDSVKPRLSLLDRLRTELGNAAVAARTAPKLTAGTASATHVAQAAQAVGDQASVLKRALTIANLVK